MSDSAYSKLTVAEKLYKTLVWDLTLDVGFHVVETYPYTSFLGLPVIKQVFEGTVRAVGDWIYARLVLVTDVTAIKLVNAEHQAAYDKESLKLKIIAQESGTDSDAFKKEHELAKASLSQFTQFGK